MIESSQLGTLRALIEPTARRLQDEGHQLFFVGGIVRDLLLDVGDFSDVDLTTDARPAAIKAALRPDADALWTQGERFGTIGAMVGDHAFEITTHRAEAYDETSRKPVVSFGDDLQTDLSRRDFTINAMAIDVSTGDLLDPYDGRGDLAERRLRTPLDPEVSFSDDPLRMLRAARFIPRFDLEAAPELVATATALSSRLEIVSGERVHDELAKLLALAAPRAGLEFLAQTGLLDQIGLGSAAGSLDQIAALDSVAARRVGLLLAMTDDEVAAFLKALRFSNADRKATTRGLAEARHLAEQLTRPEPGPLAPALRRAAVTVTDAGLDDVLATLPMLGVSTKRCLELSAALDSLRAAEDLDDRSPPLEGNDVMELLGVPAGPNIGAALAHLEHCRIDRGPLSVEDAIAELRAWSASSGDLAGPSSSA